MTVVEEVAPRLDAARPTRTLRHVAITAFTLDVVVAAAVVTAAVVVREQVQFFVVPGPEHTRQAAPFFVLAWVACIYLLGGYRGAGFGAGTEEFKRVANATLLTAGVVGVGSYLTKYELSRSFFFLSFMVGLPMLLLGRAVLRRSVHRMRADGRLKQQVLLVGSTGHVDEIASVLRRDTWSGFGVLGALTPDGATRRKTPFGVPVIGSTDQLISLVGDVGADVIFLASGSIGSAAEMRDLVWQLERHEVQVVVAPSVTDISAGRVSMRPVAGLPLMHIDPPTWAHASRIGKRTFDLVGSAMLIAFLMPVIVASALAIKLSDPGPVFFRQTRIGRNGEEFGCFKFRSMVIDAEARIQALMAAEGRDALLFKMKDDPRITRPGKWLRKLSLDELPQLFNVFRGDMSLVGPRPQVAREVALYDDAMSRRLHVRPGMTGLWQVSGRNDLTAEEAIRMDLYYVDNWSMLQDLHILFRTVGAVATSRGAY